MKTAVGLMQIANLVAKQEQQAHMQHLLSLQHCACPSSSVNEVSKLQDDSNDSKVNAALPATPDNPL